MLGHNRPESLRNIDDYKRKMAEIGRDEVERGFMIAVTGVTKWASYAFLAWDEQARDDTVAKDLWLDVAQSNTKKGKTPQTTLTNYLIEASPVEIRRYVQEAKNEIVSTISWLAENWHPPHVPTYDDVLNRINEPDEKGRYGLHSFHQKWMSLLSTLSAEERQLKAENDDAFSRFLLQQRADAAGISPEELLEREAKNAAEKKAAADAARWMEYIKRGTVVMEHCDWNGLIHVLHDQKLVQLSSADCERIRACMIR